MIKYRVENLTDEEIGVFTSDAYVILKPHEVKIINCSVFKYSCGRIKVERLVNGKWVVI
jgi:hypothetical protein